MSAEQTKTPAIRSLFIQMMMSMLMAIVVFAVCSMAFVFPQIGVLNLQIVAQQQKINALNDRISELEAAAEAAPAAAAPAPAAVAVAAPAPAAAPAATK
ncbi:MAG: hypothetical protein JST54_17640 [Deltaproteobacteria bacterium]|nr:hypothetical protein [Deltaproteobacteria bacterium]